MHSRPADVLLISQVTWEKLSPNVKKILVHASKEALDYEIKLWNKISKVDLDKIKASGVKVYNVNKEPFMKKVQPMYKHLSPQIKKIVREIQKIQEAENA